MGIAYVINGANFSALKLGKVTFQKLEEVLSFTILADENYIGRTITLSIKYIPATTNLKGVTWSITSGNEYATIDANNGILNINPSANKNQITVQAVSTFKPELIQTKVITVTYANEGGDINPKVLTAVDRINTDGGTLLYGTKEATNEAFKQHTLDLKGVEPKLDFIGYKKDPEGNVIKLYSIDERYDCTGFQNFKIDEHNRFVAIDPNDVAWIGWEKQFNDLHRIYYDGKVRGYGGWQKGCPIVNLLPCIEGASSGVFFDTRQAPAVFNIQTGFDWQYAIGIDQLENELFSFYIETTGNTTNDFVSIELNKEEKLNNLKEKASWWWKTNLIGKSWILLIGPFNYIVGA